MVCVSVFCICPQRALNENKLIFTHNFSFTLYPTLPIDDDKKEAAPTTKPNPKQEDKAAAAAKKPETSKAAVVDKR